MTKPLPATTAHEIFDGIGAIMLGLRHYLDEEEFAHKRLSREIAKLMAVDAGTAWFLKAMYLTAFGKGDEALYASEVAVRNNISTQQLGKMAINVYGNLAAHARGIEYLISATDPRNGHFTEFISWLVLFGGIRAAHRHCVQARQMGLEVPPLPVDLERAIAAIDFFDSPSFGDSQIATMLDTFCVAMMKRGLLISENQTRLVQFDDGAIQFQLPIDVSAEVGSEMTLEAIENALTIPFCGSAVSVSFVLQHEKSTIAPIPA